MYCVPTNWNGDLVVWAHGYVDVTQPLQFANLSPPDGNGGTYYAPDIIESLGYAFATTTYRQNGLAVLEGVQDIEQLVDGFSAATGEAKPTHVYQVGASEGGLITTLLAERSPQRFSGALAMCGPIGDFSWQVNYLGDTANLFNYYFPGVVPANRTGNVPDSGRANWNSVYRPAIAQAVAANPTAARQLYNVDFAPVDPQLLDATLQVVMCYWAFGTNDANQKFGGNPYDNTQRWYFGSANDLALNFTIPRFTASPTALNNLKKYATTGKPGIPLVTMHTIGDDLIPYWHEVLYFGKQVNQPHPPIVQLSVNAFGHCNFTLQDLVGAVALLVIEVGAQPIPNVQPAAVPQKAPTAPLPRH